MPLRSSLAIVPPAGLLLALVVGCAGPAREPATPAAAGVPSPPARTGAPCLWIGGAAARDAQRELARAAGLAGLPVESVGYYLDVHGARLRERLAGSGAKVEREGEELRVQLPVMTLFGAGRAELEPRSRATLDALAAVLHKYDKTVVEVAVEVDGRDAAAQRLGAERTAVVAGFLQGRGIARARIAMAARAERGHGITLTVSPLLR
jgi:outer membrane protein OmpA-like peptidoglycan-associated protein